MRIIGRFKPQSNTFIIDGNKNYGLKLKSLTINNFKNLKNIDIDFDDKDNLLVIIGNNASGKSNILEAISAIFTEVYTRKRIPDFHYELCYYFDNKFVVIKRDFDSPIFYVNGSLSTRRQIIQDNLLPSRIIALYSGEELRLWEEYYEKFYFQYLHDLSSGTYETFGRKMLYINKYYWNIALLILLLSKKDDHKDFIENKLKIDITSVRVNIDFDLRFLKRNKSDELESFIKEINPEDKKSISLSLEDLSKIITPDFDSQEQFYLEKYSMEQLFEILIYASMPKRGKIFKNIEIIFNSGLSLKSLSEGEKKYILIFTVIDVLANEKSLILLDEPDAHIHEAGKPIICDLFEKYSTDYKRQVIVTTHSPTLTHCLDDKHIIMLENKSGISQIIDTDRTTTIKKLTNDLWTETQQNIFLNSSNPLILFEGIGDIKYVNKAINFYKKEFPELKKIDFLPFGGATNACKFIEELRKIAPEDKKIIAIFDRDTEGYEGMKLCLPTETCSDGINCMKTFFRKDKNLICLMLPKTSTHNYKDFVIEDYFSVDLKKEIAQNNINEANGIFNKYIKNLKQHVKDELAKEEHHTPESMLNFKILLKKIDDIINERENLIPV